MRACSWKSAARAIFISGRRTGSPPTSSARLILFAGQVARPGIVAWDEMLLDTPVGRFAARRSVEWQPGMAAELFFRPESIELLDANRIDGFGANHGSALVERVTFLGNSADVILRSGDARLRLRAHPARIPSVGTKVSFSVCRGVVHRLSGVRY